MMGRPARIQDNDLVARLRSHMRERGHTLTEVSKEVGFNKSTLSRALKNGAFSRPLRRAVGDLVGDKGKIQSTADLLQESLRLLGHSDRMRQDAERMIAEALDRTAKN